MLSSNRSMLLPLFSGVLSPLLAYICLTSKLSAIPMMLLQVPFCCSSHKLFVLRCSVMISAITAVKFSYIVIRHVIGLYVSVFFRSLHFGIKTVLPLSSHSVISFSSFRYLLISFTSASYNAVIFFI